MAFSVGSIPAPSKKLVNQTVRLALGFSLIAPLGWIAFNFFGNGPSANPAQELTHLFGRVSIYALLFNLNLGSYLWLWRRTKTRAAVKFIFPSELLTALTRYRRHLGVAGYLYLFTHFSFHFLIEAGIYEGFLAIAEARYLWVGSSAFVIISILAMTSNNFSVRRLGRNWKPLHRLAYLTFGLATAHTLMIEKADLQHFGILAFVTALPLIVRLGFWAIEQRNV